jgi:AhpD family alkylhydroperoxidase
MTIIEVFDPAMCCSTGVCGPSVDPALSRFAADLDWLAAQDAAVTRYNLAQQPGAFAAQPLVTAALETDGEAALPVVLADGAVVSKGRYPSRDELAAWAGLSGSGAFVYGAQVDELVAIAAAIAANCEPCLDYHATAARELGVSDADIRRAVATATKVKDTPARAISRHADDLLADPSANATADDTETSGGGGCCAPASTTVTLGERDATASNGKCC